MTIARGCPLFHGHRPPINHQSYVRITPIAPPGRAPPPPTHVRIGPPVVGCMHTDIIVGLENRGPPSPVRSEEAGFGLPCPTFMEGSISSGARSISRPQQQQARPRGRAVVWRQSGAGIAAQARGAGRAAQAERRKQSGACRAAQASGAGKARGAGRAAQAEWRRQSGAGRAAQAERRRQSGAGRAAQAGEVLGFGRAVKGLVHFDWCGVLTAVRLGPPGPWWS